MAETKRLPFLGRRRAKVKKSPTEWIETLVPVDESGAAVETAGDTTSAFAPEAPHEPMGIAFPEPTRGSDLPDERTLASLRQGYVQRSPMRLDQIHAYIDEHLPSKRVPPPMRPKRAPPPISPRRSGGRPAKIVGVPIAGDVLDQKIVYETSGGYVLEVTERGVNGEVERSYYTISRVEQVGHALDALREGRPERAAARAPTFEEAKRALESAPPAPEPTAEPEWPAPESEAWPESESRPWPEAGPDAGESAAEPSAPEPTMVEFQPEGETTPPEPAAEEPGRFGKLAGKLRFRRKKKEEESSAMPPIAAPGEPSALAPEESEGKEEKRGRLRLFGRKKEQPAEEAAAPTTGTPTEPTAETEAEGKEEGGRFSRLRFRRKKTE